MVTYDPALPDPRFVMIGETSIATWVLEPVGAVRGEVVFCHGTPWCRRVWAHVARELSRDYRVFLWDMPGYGESDRDAVATDLRAQAERLVALLTFWGLRRPHVVAHDIGGAVALMAHLLHGTDFTDLFLWDIVTLDPWGSPFFALVAEHAEVFARLPANLHAALVKEYISGALPPRERAGLVDMLASPWLDARGQASFYRQIAGVASSDTRAIADALHATRCAVRIGWGRDDPWLPLGQAYELQEAFPGHAEVIVLDEVGHLAPVVRPAAVVTAVRDWLRR